MSNNKNNTIIAILVLLLLIAGAGLIYLFTQQKQLKVDYTELNVEKTKVDRLHAELQLEYDKALNQLEDLEGENASLDSLLIIKKEDLIKSKAYIASILNNQNATEKELKQAKNLIAQISDQRKQLQGTIDSLKSLNVTLVSENVALFEQKEIIQSNLDEVTETASNLENENKDLKKEKDIASILSTKNIVAKGIKTKGQNKETDSKKASATDKISICFDLLENKIAPEGPTLVMIRIIGPDGSTMALDALGSGTFTEVESGEAMQYTFKITPVFKREGKSVCSYWDQNTTYKAGNYKVEVYQSGYKIGKTSFELK